MICVIRSDVAFIVEDRMYTLLAWSCQGLRGAMLISMLLFFGVGHEKADALSHLELQGEGLYNPQGLLVCMYTRRTLVAV